jgi:hypothetical protein
VYEIKQSSLIAIRSKWPLGLFLRLQELYQGIEYPWIRLAYHGFVSTTVVDHKSGIVSYRGS